ncbi:hypothetical protein DV736_g4601, partial [Chaetothyriales sp. CBS 134916]
MRATIVAILLPCLLFKNARSQVSSTTHKDVSACACGFYDAEAEIVYTDAQIVYFNETNGFPEDDYVIQEYKHSRDFGWNSIYRQGATKQNAVVGNDTTARNLTALQLFLDPSTPEHLVMGANVRTRRQDIFYGSFRASMRPPRKWRHGSAMSMVLDHNLTESWSLDVMNTDNNTNAWISFLAKNIFPNNWLGLNFSALANETDLSPWYYTEYRVDWSKEQLDYYVGDKLRHSYTKLQNGTLPSTPSAIQYKHWSVGNRYSMQGPPLNQSEADIAWTRHFFNSSLTTKEEQKLFDARCTRTDACLMSDYSLRGSTPYSQEALKKWHQESHPYRLRWVPITIDVVMAAVFIALVTKTLVRRFRGAHSGKGKDSSHGHEGPAKDYEKKETAEIEHNQAFESYTDLRRTSSWDSFGTIQPISSGTLTPLPQYQSQIHSPSASLRPSRKSSVYNLATAAANARNDASDSFVGGSSTPTTPTDSRPRNGFGTGNGRVLPGIDTGLDKSSFEIAAHGSVNPSNANTEPSSPVQHGSPTAPEGSSTNLLFPKPEPKAKAESDKTDKPENKTERSPPVQRVDYLAGFIGLSAIMVTLNHFGLTFFPAVIEPGVPYHYRSEYWARMTIATYIFDALWIGPFLMISTRFLVSNYLRTGNLANMAQKIVVRPFRLLTPVALIAFLQYFLMDSGAIYYLEYLPSVTWSTWPFTTIVENPGIFVSQIIELAFLIPNAAPHITFTYCTGVLWTIPVQLQGAWQTLIGLIMVKECKTPWKRFAFYAFCICNHWYGLSWGSYYYAGVLLADLDLTYKYKLWLHKRPFVYYPVLWLLIAVALGGFTIDLVTQWTHVNYATFEYGWHPDHQSGLSISQAGHAVYPDYFIPRLNALLATVSMQAIVEICPTVQKVLSVKILQKIFPHIFTIYLIHGFIFWSIGSWAMCTLFEYGLPYWLCCLLVAIICYGSLFGSLPLLTPPIEAVGKSFTVRLWEHARTEPIKRKPTSYPFGPDLVSGNNDQETRSEKDTSSMMKSLHSSAKLSQETVVEIHPVVKRSP